MKITIIKFLAICCLGFIANLALADPIWIDVRTVGEYEEDHIEGDLNIPLQILDATMLTSVLMLDHNDEIILYCRSGNRAGQALEIFAEAGFTNVSNAGGITNVRALREIADESFSR